MFAGASVGAMVGEAITSVVGDGTTGGVSVSALVGNGVEVDPMTGTSVPAPHAVKRKKNRRNGMIFFIDVYVSLRVAHQRHEAISV